MGEITLVVEKCGCYVQQDTYLEEKVNIVYCPLHKAAPAMYEVLKNTLSLLVATNLNHPDDPILKCAIDNANKALAKAEAK